jgi:long-subunit fatty acid transport protein
LKGASTYRIGGEYRIEGWSLRGGYRFEESPYSNEMTIEKLQGYSLGLGYNFGNIKIDFAFDTYDQERNPRLFETGLTDRANIYRKNSNYVLSLSFDI